MKGNGRDRNGAPFSSCVALLACLVGAPHRVQAAISAASVIGSAPFGVLPDGTAINIYTLRNRHGVKARITNYGGIINSLEVPDRDGHLGDVVLGFDNLDGYLKENPYFGALIGRYGNRIAHGRFKLNGTDYRLAINNGVNALHGGIKGFDKVIWKVVKAQVSPQGVRLVLNYLSHDKEEGYPGSLNVTATYTLTEDDALRLDYSATTDKDTVVNLTQHSYFNLRGKGDILGHILQINGTRFTPVDNTLIPTGELWMVAGTPFDFRTPTAIGNRISTNDEQLKFGKGYDHNWVIDYQAAELPIQASIYEPETGRVLDVLSAEPGLQFYSGNFLDGSVVGKRGWRYETRSGFCAEPQHFPDSPNHAQFPSTELKVGQIYRNTIVYRFRTRAMRNASVPSSTD
jgi:aldose 1-epimerase